MEFFSLECPVVGLDPTVNAQDFGMSGDELVCPCWERRGAEPDIPDERDTLVA